jgi:hypothetical protein
MGLLEYQAMPSLLCLPVAHGWLCTFNIEQQLEIPSARSWAAPVRTTSTVRIGRRYKSNLSGHSLPASQEGRRVGPAL